MLRRLAAAVALLWATAASAQPLPYLYMPRPLLPFGDARQLASQDRLAAGPAVELTYRYLWLPGDPARQQRLAALLAFIVSSASRDQNVDAHRPVEIAPGLYRIDLAALQWDIDKYNAISRTDPYRPHDFPLVVRGDWLMVQLSDGVTSTAYYDLLYGNAAPKTRDEFLKFWQVDKAKHAEFTFGMIEERSNVSVQGTRWIESWPTPDARMWGTRDMLEITTGKNPIEQPDGAFRHDGEEWIGAAPKFSQTYNLRGHAQVYLLSDAAGKIVQEAPGRLVQDHAQLFGHSVIINPGSCHSCHASGLNYPTSNALRRMAQDGIEIYEARYERAQFLDRFHMTDLGKFLRRSNEDFALFVRAVNGLTPEANAAGYQAFMRDYLAPVTPRTAALELGCDEAELRSAIAFASDQGVHVGGHLSDLAHGRSMPRREWENKYVAAASYLALWRADP